MLQKRFGVTVVAAFVAAVCVGGVRDAGAAETLSPFTAVMFVADGNIGEFINAAGDSQAYFVTTPPEDPVANPNFGAIKANASLTRGVFVRRDNSPTPGTVTEAGPSGFRDPPGAIGGVFIPTGFNIGRVFVSYNPNAYGGEDGGAYFVAFDNSAPAALDTVAGTQPIAFDVDGNGSRTTATELDAPAQGVSDAPLNADKLNREGYALRINTNSAGTHEVTILIGEQVDTIPTGSVDIGPGDGNPHPPGCPATAQIISGECVRRYVLFFDATGSLPGTPQQHALLFLDSNDDNAINAADFGIGADIEFVIRNVGLLPPFPGDPDPACAIFTYIADTFDDEPLGGGGEDSVMITLQAPVPDIEAIKEARCVGDTQPFRRRVSATPGSTIEYRITVQNWGNRDLNVSLTDVQSCTTPATQQLVPGSCAIVGATPAGVPGNFCALFEAALSAPGGFPMTLGRLNAASQCDTGLGEQLVFTYRVLTGPIAPNPALCDQNVDCTDAVSVSGTMVQQVDPILAPDPPAGITADQEEEDINGGGGDVADEFNVTVVDNANAIDTMREMDAGPPADNNVAEIELNCRNLAFLKQVRIGTGAFQTGTNPINFPVGPGSYPVTVEYKYTVTNTGEDAETVTIADPVLCADVTAAPGVDFVSCPMCAAGGQISGSAPVNGMFMTSCTVRFDDPTSAQNFMGRDDSRPDCRAVNDAGAPDPQCYRNCGEASITPSPCDAGGFNADSFATICFRPECALDVTKTVRCLENCPAGAPTGPSLESLMTVPGACAQFDITIVNTGPVNIPLVCIDDNLSCNWTISNVEMSIGGVPVVPSPAYAPDGGRACLTFPGHAGGIRVGETLVISFHVQVPANFASIGTNPDCRNTIDVDGYKSTTDNTSLPPFETCTDQDQADIDVKVPSLNCNKLVSVDLDDDGFTDIDPTDSAFVSNPTYPMRLTYHMSIRNTGEVAVANARICDDNLVAHAVAVGIAVEDCALCTGPCDGAGDTCATVGALNPSQSATRTCELVVGSAAEWDAFAALDSFDGRTDCYTNSMINRGEVSGLCAPPDFNPTISSPRCSAIVCIPTIPGCVITKAKADIWNQNETRFSGSERCVVSWDQQLLSEWAPTNNFRRNVLQTDKGKARIDGIASPLVCTEESQAAPLLGVSAKVLAFQNLPDVAGQRPPDNIEMAGTNMVGSGIEPGFIKHDLPPGPSRSAAALGIADENARAEVSTKGSLLVYTKVELKWDALGRPIQDTFLDMSNNYPQDVRVQLYFVNGDQPTAPVLEGDPPVEVERAHPGCNAVDVVITLTANQPTYWSALTGLPAGVSPFTILDPGFPPGRPDDDPRNRGGRVLRGYVLAWAVDEDSQEIRWNHLLGDAVIVNYALTYAWEYPTWNFVAVAGLIEGDLLLDPLGQLNLDGIEYAYAPDQLIFTFYSSGALLSSGRGTSVLIDTDVTLFAAIKDLRQP